jgi:hypothetical protein
VPRSNDQGISSVSSVDFALTVRSFQSRLQTGCGSLHLHDASMLGPRSQLSYPSQCYFPRTAARSMVLNDKSELAHRILFVNLLHLSAIKTKGEPSSAFATAAHHRSNSSSWRVSACVGTYISTDPHSRLNASTLGFSCGLSPLRGDTAPSLLSLRRDPLPRSKPPSVRASATRCLNSSVSHQLQTRNPPR